MLEKHLNIEISRFDSCYIAIKILWDNEEIAYTQGDVPDSLRKNDNE